MENESKQYIYISIFVDSITLTGLIMCFGLDEALVVINKHILYNVSIILFYMKINSEFYTTVTVLGFNPLEVRYWQS